MRTKERKKDDYNTNWPGEGERRGARRRGSKSERAIGLYRSAFFLLVGFLFPHFSSSRYFILSFSLSNISVHAYPSHIKSFEFRDMAYAASCCANEKVSSL